MQVNDIFPSKYLKAADLGNREHSVIIERAAIETIGDDRKLVLYFQGKKKGLVTNKTNANRIALRYGDDTDSWIRKSIILYPDIVDFQGRAVEAVRVKVPLSNDAPASPTARTVREEIDDEIPF